VLADFISRAGFAIDHEATSSFFITKEEWSELLAENGIEVTDCVDISQEIANFLHDPDFEANIARIDPFKADANIRAGFKSYDQLGKLLRQRLTDYVLLTARKRADVPTAELKRRNLEVLAVPTRTRPSPSRRLLRGRVEADRCPRPAGDGRPAGCSSWPTPAAWARPSWSG